MIRWLPRKECLLKPLGSNNSRTPSEMLGIAGVSRVPKAPKNDGQNKGLF